MVVIMKNSVAKKDVKTHSSKEVNVKAYEYRGWLICQVMDSARIMFKGHLTRYMYACVAEENI